MMKKQFIASAIATTLAGAVMAAQTPATGSTQPQEPRPTASTQAPMKSAGETTLTGCVYREADVPGRTPNVAERAGVLEDYILVASSSAAGETAAAQPNTPPTPAGTSGVTAPMYKLEKIADERLRAMVGKRVEVTGRIDAEAGDTKVRPGTAAQPHAGQHAGEHGTQPRGTQPQGTQPQGTPSAQPQADKNYGPDTIELPEFEVTSIREVAGTCPAAPSK
jgi:hypothetical protein